MSSETIYDSFKPTYLYIKQHTVTGMLYFGKTSYNNPETYLGSGTYWLNHINKHGNEHVITLWYCLFVDAQSIEEFALMCSKYWDIVNSDSWANLKEENGLDGGLTMHSEETKSKMSATRKGRQGIIPSSETRRKMSIASSGRIVSDETKKRISATKTGSHHSIETRLKLSKSRLGVPRGPSVLPMERVVCPHCLKSGGKNAMTRWHFDNCRLKVDNSNLS